MKKILKLTYLTAAVALLLSSYAFAYLDPATLTYVIQIVAGVVIAGGAAVGIFWKRIRLFFKKKGEKAPEGQGQKSSRKAGCRRCLTIRSCSPTHWRLSAAPWKSHRTALRMSCLSKRG